MDIDTANGTIPSLLPESTPAGVYDDMAWAEPEYSVQQVNAAGKALVSAARGGATTEERKALIFHIEVINNWRASHNYPLNTFQINLRNCARRIDTAPIVAQRIKRLVSIALKLDRSPTMKLSQMQDIGGCRAVLSSVDKVREVVDYYQNVSRMKHDPGPVDDYISNPKDSGYRGIHLIYRYVSDKKKTAYNGLKIEMQLRSRYQHAWATAVETVGLFVGQALKTSIGDDEWLRFFELMGSAIAMRERCALVPGTPEDKKELIDELRHYATTLDVERRLAGYANALQYIMAGIEDAHWYLLQLNPKASELSVSGFSLDEREAAERKYSEAEEIVQANPGTDAVLVSVASAADLQRAYPNYFADTGVFVELLSQALSGRARRIGETKIKPAARQLTFDDLL